MAGAPQRLAAASSRASSIRRCAIGPGVGAAKLGRQRVTEILQVVSERGSAQGEHRPGSIRHGSRFDSPDRRGLNDAVSTAIRAREHTASRSVRRSCRCRAHARDGRDDAHTPDQASAALHPRPGRLALRSPRAGTASARAARAHKAVYRDRAPDPPARSRSSYTEECTTCWPRPRTTGPAARRGSLHGDPRPDLRRVDQPCGPPRCAPRSPDGIPDARPGRPSIALLAASGDGAARAAGGGKSRQSRRPAVTVIISNDVEKARMGVKGGMALCRSGGKR